jgi:glycosyltransferase involved in cell wall biosynthesis
MDANQREEPPVQVKIAVCRIGALFHYAIPRALHRRGLLERFYTDLWTGSGWFWPLHQLPGWRRWPALTKLRERWHPELPNRLVRSFPALGLNYHRKLRQADSAAHRLRAHLEAADAFCRRVVADGLAESSLVHVSNTQGLGVLRYAKQRGLRTCLEQTIAPYKFEHQLITQELEQFPGWEDACDPQEPAILDYCQREVEEWKLSDTILCGSDFVRRAIDRVGGPAHKCRVVPYAYENEEAGRLRTRPHRPIHVLVPGTVCLRKGIQYVREAAGLAASWAVFRSVGSVRVSKPAEALLRERLELRGPVARSEMRRHYEWADIVLLPSLCEGSATVAYEALSWGLPVVCTSNTGSLARHGENGLLVPIRNSQAIAAALEALVRHPHRLGALSQGALSTRPQFTLDAYAERLVQALEEFPGDCAGQ